MSQQEFEPQRSPGEEIYQPQYPYSWSSQEQEGMPRDEPPASYGEYQDQSGQAGQGQWQVPWWARPQPHQNGPFVFAAIVVLVVFIAFVIGALGIVGVVIGSLAHIVGVVIGAIFALVVFSIVLVILVLSLIWRAFGKVFGLSSRRYYGQAQRRMARRTTRHYSRRSARRFWRGPW